MNDALTESFFKYEEMLEKIIKKETPLRDPSITVVKIPAVNAENILKRHQLLLRKFKKKYKNWTYKTLNLEKQFFEKLKAREFTDGEQVVNNCDRQEFENDMRNVVLNDLIGDVEREIHELKDSYRKDGRPPFLVLLNMHSTYPFIETGDVISRIINEKGVFVIILYISGITYRIEDAEPFKNANYTVQTFSFM
jgi:hypothetical protein